MENLQPPARQKNYNIWASGLQEESLMENLKGCGVDRESTNYDRNIESYDYKLKYRLNGENTLKRRQSTNSDDSSNGKSNFNFFSQQQQSSVQSKSKRFRTGEMGSNGRKNVRLRLGSQKSDDSSSNDSHQLNGPRRILDLNITENSSNEDVARDLANKLYEEKDDLMCKYI